MFYFSVMTRNKENRKCTGRRAGQRCAIISLYKKGRQPESLSCGVGSADLTIKVAADPRSAFPKEVCARYQSQHRSYLVSALFFPRQVRFAITACTGCHGYIGFWSDLLV